MIPESAYAPSTLTAQPQREEDDVPGASAEPETSDGPGTSFMPSPKKTSSVLRAVRKKSINYQGVKVTKDLFPPLPKIKIWRLKSGKLKSKLIK